MERAKQLITQQQLPIQVVADFVGYQDVGHFSRVFKQTVGQPPSHYAREFSARDSSTRELPEREEDRS